MTGLLLHNAAFALLSLSIKECFGAGDDPIAGHKCFPAVPESDFHRTVALSSALCPNYSTDFKLSLQASKMRAQISNSSHTAVPGPWTPAHGDDDAQLQWERGFDLWRTYMHKSMQHTVIHHYFSVWIISYCLEKRHNASSMPV
jgi:hypothetical protein